MVKTNEMLTGNQNKGDDEEEKVLTGVGYPSLSRLYGLPLLRRGKKEQISTLKEALGICRLETLKRAQKSTFLRQRGEMNEENIIKANVMITLAVNAASNTRTPPFDMKKLDTAVDAALKETTNYEEMYTIIQEEFRKAGVAFFILPHIPGSRLRGAVKKLGRKVLLLVSDRNRSVDAFFFTLLHEVAHIKAGDWGPYFECDERKAEERADRYAEDMLIPKEEYRRFFSLRSYSKESILAFSRKIRRESGIVVARLQKDGVVRYDDKELNSLKHRFRVVQDTSICLRSFSSDT